MAEGSFGASAVILRTILGSRDWVEDGWAYDGLYGEQEGVTASAIMGREVNDSLTADTLLRRSYAGSFQQDASLIGTMVHEIDVAAVVFRVTGSSVSANAYIVNPFRTQHPRDNTAHYDFDWDTVITLAAILNVYPQGMSLHEVLAGIVHRIEDLEAAE
jgi:hypothetical protein